MESAFGDAEASVDATGVSVTRDEKGTIHVTGESVVGREVARASSLGALTAEVDGGKLKDAHVESARVALELGAKTSAATQATQAAPEPPPPPPTRHKGRRPRRSRFIRSSTLPNLHVLRAMMQNVGKRVADRAPEGLHVDLDALDVELARGKEKLELGPGKVTIERRASELAVDFSAGTGQTPLTLHTSVPLEAGDTTVALAGGPVTLSMLGVREGAFGFVDPARATITGKARVTLDDAREVAHVRRRRLGERRVGREREARGRHGARARRARLGARRLDDTGAVRLDDAEAQLGALHVRAHGGVEQTNDHLVGEPVARAPRRGLPVAPRELPRGALPARRASALPRHVRRERVRRVRHAQDRRPRAQVRHRRSLPRVRTRRRS